MLNITKDIWDANVTESFHEAYEFGFDIHQGREFIANGALENGAFCTVFSENFHKF
jgi:hypothetical protein